MSAIQEVSDQDKHQEKRFSDLKTAALIPSLPMSLKEVVYLKRKIYH